MNTAKLPFAVVLCGLAACSVYEDSLGGGSPDGGAASSQGGSAGSDSQVTTGSGGSTTTDGTGGSSTSGGASGAAGSEAAGGAGGAAGAATTGGGSGAAGSAAGGAAGKGGAAGVGGAGAGGAGAGGAGGAAGAGGAGGTGVVDAGSEAGPVGICNYANPITLLYRWWPVEAGASRVDFSFKFVNGSTQALQLDAITVRYYLTNEIAAPSAVIAYGDICCPDKVITSHVTARVQPMVPPAAGADTYIEFAFDATAGTLAPAHTLEVEVEFANAVGSVSNSSNDYSYIAAATGTQAQWDNCPSTGNCAPFHSCLMTVYQGGTLVWGTPPK